MVELDDWKGGVGVFLKEITVDCWAVSASQLCCCSMLVFKQKSSHLHCAHFPDGSNF